jgi:hypothetical protein
MSKSGTDYSDQLRFGKLDLDNSETSGYPVEPSNDDIDTCLALLSCQEVHARLSSGGGMPLTCTTHQGTGTRLEGFVYKDLSFDEKPSLLYNSDANETSSGGQH